MHILEHISEHLLKHRFGAHIGAPTRCTYWSTYSVHILEHLLGAHIGAPTRCTYWSTYSVHILEHIVGAHIGSTRRAISCQNAETMLKVCITAHFVAILFFRTIQPMEMSVTYRYLDSEYILSGIVWYPHPGESVSSWRFPQEIKSNSSKPAGWAQRGTGAIYRLSPLNFKIPKVKGSGWIPTRRGYKTNISLYVNIIWMAKDNTSSRLVYTYIAEL